jgi:uncharacterized protein (TIGR03435 family)
MCFSQIRRTLLTAAVAVCACTLALGQATASLTFEVASVKPSAPGWERGGVYFGPPRGGPGTPDPVQITWTYARFRGLLMTAYGLKTYQITGPAWLDTERYDIVAKVPPGATKQQVNVMWQNLLAERFGLRVHHEPKEFQVEELVIARGGSKLKDTAWDPATPLPPGPPQRKDGELLSPGAVVTIFPGPNAKAHMAAKAQPLSKLADMLGNDLRRPVLDKTGLTGLYDFNLDYRIDLSGFPLPPGAPAPSPDAPTAGASDPGPDFAAAVQQQLGLRLVAGRANLDVLVIDKAERVPSEN